MDYKTKIIIKSIVCVTSEEIIITTGGIIICLKLPKKFQQQDVDHRYFYN